MIMLKNKKMIEYLIQNIPQIIETESDLCDIDVLSSEMKNLCKKLETYNIVIYRILKKVGI